MSRQVQMVMHFFAMFIGQLASSNILATAARAFGWSEDYKDLLVQVCFLFQGIIQAMVSYVAQAYNTDGSRPGKLTMDITPETPPKTTVVVETKKVEE